MSTYMPARGRPLLRPDLDTEGMVGGDDQTLSCRRLLAAIVMQAVFDASLPPDREESRRQANRPVSHDAVDFLFRPDGLELLAPWLDLDATWVRRQLLTVDEASTAHVPHAHRRRHLRTRHQWWAEGRVMEGASSKRRLGDHECA